MVLSKLNAAVKYPESRKIYRDDIKKEVDLYEVEIERVDIIIALGNMRNQYEEENILYYPIYLVKHNNKVIQIGLYEIEASNYQYYLDTYDNVDRSNYLFFCDKRNVGKVADETRRKERTQ